MFGNRQRPLLQQLAEGLLAIVLVLVFFFIIMLVLNALFPHGGLQLFSGSEQARGTGNPDRVYGQRSLELTREGSPQSLDGGDWAATLVELHNQVKSKRAVDIAWQAAEAGMTLRSLDAVQTLNDSTARIRFDQRNEIDLGANSLIIIRRMEQDLLFREKRSFMVVVDGELRGRLGGEGDGNVYLEVTTPNAVARLQTGDAGETPVEFSISVDQGDQSIVTLFSGRAEVEAGGETVQLEANQLTRIAGDAVPAVPVELPKQAQLQTPVADAVFFFRDLPPRVRFSWQPPPDAKSFRLQIARDADFHDLLIDETLTDHRFMHGNLAPGTYFWRVSSFSANGEGGFSPARSFRLVADSLPPELVVEDLPERVTTAQLEIHGHSEKDARVFIAGNAVPLAGDGSFHYRLTLNPGANVIVIEAADAAGNISYSSHLLTAQFSE